MPIKFIYYSCLGANKAMLPAQRAMFLESLWAKSGYLKRFSKAIPPAPQKLRYNLACSKEEAVKDTHEVYPIEIAGVKRELRLFEVKPGLRIAILNILGDVELVDACAHALAAKLKDEIYDVIVTAEAKSIPIAHMLARETGKTLSGLAQRTQALYGQRCVCRNAQHHNRQATNAILDEKDELVGKQVLLLDDVISTGSTLQGMHLIIEKAGGKLSKSAILTEGDRAQWRDIVCLGHLPLFTD